MTIAPRQYTARPAVVAVATLAALAGIGAAAATLHSSAEGHAAPAPRTITVEVAPTADGRLSFPAGVYMSHRVSDHVTLPPGTTLTFSNLPPGLSYDPATTAIQGTPTTPGVYTTTGTAYIGGIAVRTVTVTVTITGTTSGQPAPAPAPAPAQPGPAPAPSPGSPTPGSPGPGVPGIDPVFVDTLPVPPEVKALVRSVIAQINAGILAIWNAVPAGSLGK